MGVYITEGWLREHFGLGFGSEVHLPANSRLTPAAEGMLTDKKITILFEDANGNLVKTPAASQDKTLPESGAREKRVNPLTGKSGWEPASCLMCHQVVQKKPETLTHLDAKNFISKNDPRLRFRGKVDTAIAQAILVQAEFDPKQRYPLLSSWLADVRSALGYILRSEVTGELFPPLKMGDLDDASIRKVSHDPLKYLGHDHIVPAVEHGIDVARLNLLRAKIREAELSAAEVYITRDFEVERPDIMAGLNRLSSAVYVLMILVLLAEKGKPVLTEGVKNDTP